MGIPLASAASVFLYYTQVASAPLKNNHFDVKNDGKWKCKISSEKMDRTKLVLNVTCLCGLNEKLPPYIFLAKNLLFSQ